jgi:hypothetical protein
MRTTLCANGFCAHHAMCAVDTFFYGTSDSSLIEAGPTTARVKFGTVFWIYLVQLRIAGGRLAGWLPLTYTGDPIINQTIEFAPIILLLDNHTAAIVVPIKALLDAMWGLRIHSNIDAHTGKLQYIINGPEMHQWHHSDHQEVFYSNYSTKFAIWDWLFGTAFLPGLKPFQYQMMKPDKFGLPYDYPRDYFMQHWFAFHRFDVKKIESIPVVKAYVNWKTPLLRLFGKKEEQTAPLPPSPNPQPSK